MISAHRALLSALLPLGFVCVITACDDKDQLGSTASSAAATPAAPKNEPTVERVEARCRERWAKVEKGDWVAAYDFGAPEMKREMPLSRYLTQVESHEYKNAKILDVIGVAKEEAVLHIGVTWTPHHPQLAQVKLEPGQTLTQQIDMVEIWRWTGSDWYFVRPDRTDEFYQAHPDLLKKDAAPVPLDTPVAPPPVAPPKK